MGIGQVVFDTLAKTAKFVIDRMFGWFSTPVIDELTLRTAKKSLNVDMFQTKEVKDAVTKLKESWAHSPEDSSDIVDTLLQALTGHVAKLQLEAITDKKVDGDMPLASKLFDQMALITDLNLLSNALAIIGEFFPFVHLDRIGAEIRAYLDYSGLTQITGFGYGMLLSAALAPKITQEIDAKMQNAPLDARDVVNLFYREEFKEPTFYKKMALKGFNETNAGYMKKAQRLHIDAKTLINLYHRKLIEPENFKLLMRKQGWHEDDILRMLKEAQYFPTPGEVILWAAREVFEPEERKKLKLDDKFPEKFWEYAEKAGMTRVEAENFWAAHWTFPGWNTIQEMRWRNIINDEDVETFFTEADIVPFWRDAMREVMYSPYTRVDGRRMYETGILSRDEFKTAMTDIGYTEERAEGLAKWATERKMSPQKDLTMSKIEKAFREGEIDAANFLERIKEMGYDEDEATLILNLLKRDVEEKEEKENIDWFILRYKNGLISVEELTAFLDTLGINEAKKNKLILKAKNAKASLAKTASKSDLDLWFIQDIINEETYKTRLESLGYEENDINNYYASIVIKKGE